MIYKVSVGFNIDRKRSGYEVSFLGFRVSREDVRFEECIWCG